MRFLTILVALVAANADAGRARVKAVLLSHDYAAARTTVSIRQQASGRTLVVDFPKSQWLKTKKHLTELLGQINVRDQDRNAVKDFTHSIAELEGNTGWRVKIKSPDKSTKCLSFDMPIPKNSALKPEYHVAVSNKIGEVSSELLLRFAGIENTSGFVWPSGVTWHLVTNGGTEVLAIGGGIKAKIKPNHSATVSLSAGRNEPANHKLMQNANLRVGRWNALATMTWPKRWNKTLEAIPPKGNQVIAVENGIEYKGTINGVFSYGPLKNVELVRTELFAQKSRPVASTDASITFADVRTVHYGAIGRIDNRPIDWKQDSKWKDAFKIELGPRMAALRIALLAGPLVTPLHSIVASQIRLGDRLLWQIAETASKEPRLPGNGRQIDEVVKHHDIWRRVDSALKQEWLRADDKYWSLRSRLLGDSQSVLFQLNTPTYRYSDDYAEWTKRVRSKHLNQFYAAISSRYRVSDANASSGVSLWLYESAILRHRFALIDAGEYDASFKSKQLKEIDEMLEAIRANQKYWWRIMIDGLVGRPRVE